MSRPITHPISERDGAAYAPAFAARIAAEGAWLDAQRDPPLGAAARASLLTWLLRRMVGVALTAMVEDGGPPIGRDQWRAFYAHYPVLARLHAASIAEWRAGCSQLRHAIGPLEDVRVHAGFQAARRPTFVCTLGDGAKRVYRALDLSVGVWFMDLSAALDLGLHVRRITSTAGESFDEFLEARAPTGEDEIHRYFVRAGMLVRLCEAVRAIDLHLHNVMMVGEQPAIIDLEGILACGEPPTPLTAGFLPHPVHGVNLGGLNLGGTIVFPLRQPHLRRGQWAHGFKIERMAPTVPAPPELHADEILSGYRLLDERLAGFDAAPWIARARGLAVRRFRRSGVAYREILFASVAPALLRSEHARDRFLATQADGDEWRVLRDLRVPHFIGRAERPELVRHSPEVLATNEEMIRSRLGT